MNDKDILFKEKRLAESFGKENIEKAVMYRIEYQLGYSTIYSRDAWVTTIYSAEELLYIIKYIIYNFIKLFHEEGAVTKEFQRCAVLCTRGEMIADILIKHYKGCTGYINGVSKKYIDICFISHDMEERYLKEKGFEEDNRFYEHHKNINDDLTEWIRRYINLLSERNKGIYD